MVKSTKKLLRDKTPTAVQKSSPTPRSIEPGAPNNLTLLQSTLGNRATGRFIQAKLRVNQPGDRYEQEADRVAEQLMRMPEPEIRRQPKDEEELQRVSEDEEELQTKTAGNSAPQVSNQVQSQIESLRGGGQPLPERERAFFEPRFGHDFGDVRVHSGEQAADVTQAVNAKAFTVGQEIMFGAGQFAPGNPDGQRLLAHELTHVIQQGSNQQHETAVIQPKSKGVKPKSTKSTGKTKSKIIEFKKGTTITADPTEAKRTFSRLRESVQSYSDNSLDYMSNQYLSAMTSFQIWYNGQPRADAAFFNSVVNLIMNTAWAWGTPAVGAIVAPVGSIIMLIAQEAASTIQTSRDQFADSLIKSANNFQSGVQREFSGKVPDIIESKDPGLWEEIELRAYLGENWQPLLHERALLPRRGDNIQVRLLSKLIFEYRNWDHQQKSNLYKGVYSFGDPYLQHMKNRAEAEAFVESGLPIPKRLGEYRHKGEKLEGE